MPDALEQLVDSLLYEGYALYPYTPAAIKNATPTPFGIVYPPAYAAECVGAFDHARLECVAEADDRGRIAATVRYLVADGERHRAAERRVELGPIPAGERETVRFEDGRLTLRSSEEEGGRLRVRCCVHNEHAVSSGLTRAEALRYSLLSTQLIVRIAGGRFLSPLEAGSDSVNTYPVLASDEDDTVLGTTIVLPDHPVIAPESRGNLFDSSEIEEALLLHVHALSDAERAEIAQADPTVREMVSRAAAATPEDIIALHGRVTLRDPVSPRDPASARDPLSTEPPQPPDDLPDPTAGEPEVTVDGVRFVRGGRVILRPAPEADLHARLVEGRTATVERILVDVDGRVHLGVTIDDDPGQLLLRETGRYLYFFAPELEVIDT